MTNLFPQVEETKKVHNPFNNHLVFVCCSSEYSDDKCLPTVKEKVIIDLIYIHRNKEESIPEGCVPAACQPYVIRWWSLDTRCKSQWGGWHCTVRSNVQIWTGLPWWPPGVTSKASQGGVHWGPMRHGSCDPSSYGCNDRQTWLETLHSCNFIGGQ